MESGWRGEWEDTIKESAGESRDDKERVSYTDMNVRRGAAGNNTDIGNVDGINTKGKENCSTYQS